MAEPNNKTTSRRSVKSTVPRVDFSTFGTPTAITGVRHYTLSNGHGRDFRVAHLEQLQDSLQAHPEIKEAQYYPILSVALEEPGADGFASRGIGGNGQFGMSKERMPIDYVGPTSKHGGLQIHHFLEEVKGLNSGQWHDGGNGGPRIVSAKDGHDQFWNNTDVHNAALILNKSFVRPAERETAWENRANTAVLLQQYAKKNRK